MNRGKRVRVVFGGCGRVRLVRAEQGANPGEQDALCQLNRKSRNKRRERVYGLFLMAGLRGLPSSPLRCTFTRPGFSQSFGCVFKGCA